VASIPQSFLTSRDTAQVQYGGETFERACRFVGRFQRRPPSSSGPEADGWLEGPLALLTTLKSLPRLTVRVSETPSGQVIKDRLRSRRWGVPKNRLAQGVLSLPISEEDYLRQRTRIVGRQVRAARAAEITCAQLPSSAERWELLRQITPRVAGMHEWVDTLPHRDDDQWWAARDNLGHPVAFAIVVADTDWAMLQLLRTNAHPPRYLLHTEIVTTLARDGVRYLVTDSPMALRMDPNLRSFQRLLGYQVANLSLV
jgi:hypothetical protein